MVTPCHIKASAGMTLPPAPENQGELQDTSGRDDKFNQQEYRLQQGCS